MAKRKQWKSDFAKQISKANPSLTVEGCVRLLVSKKLRHLDSVNPPVNLEILASVCGIRKIEYIRMLGDGRLVRTGRSFIIQIDNTSGRTRQRFTIAHEIGHKILTDAIGKPIGTIECSQVGRQVEKSEEEQLCDLAAREIHLLIPKYLHPVISDKGFSYEAVSHVENRFDVSFEAAIRGLAENAPREVAAIFLAMGYRKEERAQLAPHQPPLFPDMFTRPKEKLRVARGYYSSSFADLIPFNKSIPDNSFAYQILNTDRIVHGEEVWNFKQNISYLVQIEAIPRIFYIDSNNTVSGIVALLTNPHKLN